MSAWALIAAAGTGERLGIGDGVPKAMRRVGDAAMFVHSLRAFDAVGAVEGAVLVTDELWMEHALSELVDEKLRIKLEMVRGGASRQASVREGLKAVPPGADAVVVHDAARPLVTSVLIERVLDAVGSRNGAICAVPVEDTLKRVEGSAVVETVRRDDLWRVQTPQAFRSAILRDAHQRALDEGFEGTDDAMLVEHAGGAVVVVPGDTSNLKVTTRADLAIAQALLAARGDA